MAETSLSVIRQLIGLLTYKNSLSMLLRQLLRVNTEKNGPSPGPFSGPRELSSRAHPV